MILCETRGRAGSARARVQRAVRPHLAPSARADAFEPFAPALARDRLGGRRPFVRDANCDPRCRVDTPYASKQG